MFEQPWVLLYAQLDSEPTGQATTPTAKCHAPRKRLSTLRLRAALKRMVLASCVLHRPVVVGNNGIGMLAASKGIIYMRNAHSSIEHAPIAPLPLETAVMGVTATCGSRW